MGIDLFATYITTSLEIKLYFAIYTGAFTFVIVHMYLKIASPEHPIYEGKIRQITLPTAAGEITILPGHQPLTTVVVAWLITVVPESLPQDITKFTIDGGDIIIAVSKGLLLVDGDKVLITTSAATTSTHTSVELLEEMKTSLQAELDKITVEGNMEEFEKAMMNYEKITADLRLAKLKWVSN